MGDSQKTIEMVAGRILKNAESNNKRVSTTAGIGETGMEIHSTDQSNSNCNKNMKSRYHDDRERKYQADEESKGTEARKKFDKAGQLRPAAKKPNPSTTEAGGEETKSFNNPSQRQTKRRNKRKRVEKHVAL